MDCRKTLLMAVCLLGTGVGCITTPGVPGGSAQNMMGMDPTKVTSTGKAKVTPDLMVATGEYVQRAAEQPTATSQQKEALYEEARKNYQKALELDAANKKASIALGGLYTKLGDQDRALATYDKAVKKHPKDAALWCEKGLCHCCRKEWNPAIESFKKANALDPENREYTTEFGYCLARAGRTDESVACLAKIHGEAQAHYKVARMLQHLNQPEESKRHLRLALQARPDLQPAKEMLAQLEGPAPGEQHPVVNIGFQTGATEKQ